MKLGKTVLTALATLALAGFAMSGCSSSDGANACDDFCDTACTKAQQCGVFDDFGFTSFDECRRYCKDSVGDATSDECRDNERELSAQGCSWFDTRI